MKEKLENAKKFLDIHNAVHNKLSALAPLNIEENPYENQRYINVLYKETIILRKMFFSLIDFLELNCLQNYVENLFDNICLQIDCCSYSKMSIQGLYFNYYSNISETFVDKVNRNCIGYFVNVNVFEIMRSCSTLNELILFLHSYFQNCYALDTLPLIATKNNFINEKISLYGENTPLGAKFFDQFPQDLDCGVTTIVAFSDSLYVIIRDRGHALSLTITKEQEKIFVKYFIPKLINLDMIRNLKGISNLTDNWAQGVFEGSINEIFEFIQNVPTDEDMLCDIKK